MRTFNDRYACYKDIKLEGKAKKDVEYCEFIHLSNMTSKYECIDSLNSLVALDDATEDCINEDKSGTNLRKESLECTFKKYDILVGVGETS